ncbi:hypothetical protein H6P81_008125 [Aristolochia fimbriata]|uniref:TF-B3 domain-containing protein n=1 Tax=Aristolochia fimbriata TaxID=158543 RepID=A0AAV7F5V6_ARIFI|nr:hypothetical protein H6P81_008125 [Aristolochia fimbriata]
MVGPRYYQLKIPGSIRRILPKATTPVTLLYRNKRWEMAYKGSNPFQGLCFLGWKKFVLDNEIMLGEGIVFELVNSEDVEFKVPPSHFRKKLPAAAVTVTLSYRNKRWEVRYRGDSSFKSFTRPTWKKFVMDNNVRFGDGLVFELINAENLEFKVQILRSEEPPESFEGQSLDSTAIVID